jgi:hypothetical protein
MFVQRALIGFQRQDAIAALIGARLASEFFQLRDAAGYLAALLYQSVNDR